MKRKNRERSLNAGLFRTKEAGKPREESECRASSDKGSEENRERSPNAGLVRPKEAGKPREESECRASSDKGSEKPERGVRIQGYFGQRRQENRERSPNAGLFRTREAGKSREESECRASSDKGSEKTERGVRMQGYFGQRRQENGERSPNAGLIRPKEAGKPREGSECRVSSDKGSGKTERGVRMQG